VLIECDSVAQAVATHDSPGYQAALKALGNAAERDIRIVDGNKDLRGPNSLRVVGNRMAGAAGG